MSCTTILVGKKASYDGSTIIARDDDSGSGRYDPKKFIAVAPQDQPRHYRSVLSHVEIDLPDNPCRYSIVPNVLPNRGILPLHVLAVQKHFPAGIRMGTIPAIIVRVL